MKVIRLSDKLTLTTIDTRFGCERKKIISILFFHFGDQLELLHRKWKKKVTRTIHTSICHDKVVSLATIKMCFTSITIYQCVNDVSFKFIIIIAVVVEFDLFQIYKYTHLDCASPLPEQKPKLHCNRLRAFDWTKEAKTKHPCDRIKNNMMDRKEFNTF